MLILYCDTVSLICNVYFAEHYCIHCYMMCIFNSNYHFATYILRCYKKNSACSFFMHLLFILNSLLFIIIYFYNYFASCTPAMLGCVTSVGHNHIKTSSFLMTHLMTQLPCVTIRLLHLMTHHDTAIVCHATAATPHGAP